MSLKNIIGDAILRSYFISEHSKRLAIEDFPNETPKYLAEAIESFSNSIGIFLVKKLNSSYKDDEILLCDLVIKLIAEPLRYIDGATSNKVPWSLVYPFQEFANRYVPGIILIFRPMWSFNYGILRDDISEYLNILASRLLIDNIPEKVKSLHGNFHIISFPFTDRKSILLHSILAHEIGHIIINKFISEETSKIPNKLKDDIINYVKRDDSILPILKSERIARIQEEVAEYRKRAIEEIGSDIAGIRMLGPASLFAYYYFALSDPDNEPSPENNRYPPWRYRIKYALETLLETDLCEITKKISSYKKCEDYIKVFNQNIDEITSVQLILEQFQLVASHGLLFRA